jgi:hypothetical protein
MMRMGSHIQADARQADARQAHAHHAHAALRLCVLLGLALALCIGTFQTLLSPCAPAYAQANITIAELEDASAELDGCRVDIVGEAIGDILAAHDGYVWITLVDLDPQSKGIDTASINVYMTSKDAELISNLGRFRVVGSTVEVSGVFHLACPEHEGLSDVHASSVRILDEGGSTEQRVDVGLLIFGVVLIAVAGLLLFLFYVLRERLR